MRLSSLVLLAVIATGASAQSGVSTNYAVTTFGDTLRTNVEFKDPLLGRSHLLVDGERHEIDEFSILHIDGVTSAVVEGRRLARLLSDGRIRFYARTVTTAGTMMPMGGPGGGMMMSPGTSSEVGYIQTSGGPVQKATYANLSEAMADNPESMRLLARSRSLTTTRWVVTGLGVAAFAAGGLLIYNAEQNGESYTPFIPIAVAGAAGIAAGSYLLPGLADDARDEAIDIYNQ